MGWLNGIDSNQCVPMPRTKPVVAAVDVFGCDDGTSQIIRNEMQLRVGDLYNRTAIRCRVRELRQRTRFALLDLTALQYPDSPSLIFITIDVVEQNEETWKWTDPPRAWHPFPPALSSFAEVTHLYHPKDTSFQSSIALRRVMEDTWPICVKALLEDYRSSQRAQAAAFLGWAPNETQVVDALLTAMADSDRTVRNNASRSLLPFCQHTKSREAIVRQVTRVIDLLHSPMTMDRNKAAAILLELIDAPTVRESIYCQAVPRLRAMAQLWQPGNALFAQLILAHLGVNPIPPYLIPLIFKARHQTIRLQTFLVQSVYRNKR